MALSMPLKISTLISSNAFTHTRVLFKPRDVRIRSVAFWLRCLALGYFYYFYMCFSFVKTTLTAVIPVISCNSDFIDRVMGVLSYVVTNIKFGALFLFLKFRHEGIGTTGLRKRHIV